MHRIVEKECVQCGICTDSCPAGAIKFDAFYFIDSNQCNGCRICETACPLGAIQAQTKQTP